MNANSKRVNETAHRKMSRAAFGILLSASLLGAALFPAGTVSAQGTVIIQDPQSFPHKVKTAAETTATRIITGKTLVEQIVQTANSVAMHFKEFVGDHLATVLAKAALRSITQSIVNWINSGFAGSPAFVTNPEGFLLDVADQTIGQAIDYAAPLLCAPFRFDIRLALGLDYSFGGSRDIRCRLTDVIANLEGSYDAFVAGNFTAGGGWNSWIAITGVPQNNPYGAYLETVDKIDARIISATGQEVKLLDFGRGFLSFRECEIQGNPYSYDPDGIPGNGDEVTRRGPCQKKGPIKTPGSVIEGQLQSALGVDLQSLAFADEINEIFAALINQLVKQVFTRGGLVNARNYSRTDYANSYSPGSAETTQTLQTLSVDLNPTQIRNALNAAAGNERNTGTVSNNARVQRQDAAGTTIVTGIQSEAKLSLAELAVQSGANQGLSFAVTDQNLAGSDNGMPKTVRQSSMENQSTTGPEKGVDGQTEGTVGGYGGVMATLNELNPWWEVDLGQEYVVATVQIFPRQGERYESFLKNSYLFVTADQYQKNAGVTVSDGVQIPIPKFDTVYIEVPVNKTGRYLRVQRSDSGVLSFAELRAFQSKTNPKPIPQFGMLNLTANLYHTFGEGVNVKKGIVQAADTGLWQSKFPEWRAVKGIDGNINGVVTGDSGNSVVGIVNPLLLPLCIPRHPIRQARDCFAWPGVRMPWWEVDLGDSVEISEVKLWRRTDIAPDDNSGLAGGYKTRLFVSDVPYDPTKRPSSLGGIIVNDYLAPAGEPEPRPYTIPVNQKGRYVRLQKFATAQDFWFAEVMVFAKPGGQKDAATPTLTPATGQVTVTPEFSSWRPTVAAGSTETTGQHAFEIQNLAGVVKTVTLTVGVRANARPTTFKDAGVVGFSVQKYDENEKIWGPFLEWNCSYSPTYSDFLGWQPYYNCGEKTGMTEKNTATANFTLPANETAKMSIITTVQNEFPSQSYTGVKALWTEDALKNRWELVTDITSKQGNRDVYEGTQVVSFYAK